LRTGLRRLSAKKEKYELSQENKSMELDPLFALQWRLHQGRRSVETTFKLEGLPRISDGKG